jgi:hypothetical protein
MPNDNRAELGVIPNVTTDLQAEPQLGQSIPKILKFIASRFSSP